MVVAVATSVPVCFFHDVDATGFDPGCWTGAVVEGGGEVEDGVVSDVGGVAGVVDVDVGDVRICSVDVDGDVDGVVEVAAGVVGLEGEVVVAFGKGVRCCAEAGVVAVGLEVVPAGEVDEGVGVVPPGLVDPSISEECDVCACVGCGGVDVYGVGDVAVLWRVEDGYSRGVVVKTDGASLGAIFVAGGVVDGGVEVVLAVRMPGEVGEEVCDARLEVLLLT